MDIINASNLGEYRSRIAFKALLTQGFSFQTFEEFIEKLNEKVHIFDYFKIMHYFCSLCPK
jgi:hypothetical protein